MRPDKRFKRRSFRDGGKEGRLKTVATKRREESEIQGEPRRRADVCLVYARRRRRRHQNDFCTTAWMMGRLVTFWNMEGNLLELGAGMISHVPKRPQAGKRSSRSDGGDFEKTDQREAAFSNFH